MTLPETKEAILREFESLIPEMQVGTEVEPRRLNEDKVTVFLFHALDDYAKAVLEKVKNDAGFDSCTNDNGYHWYFYHLPESYFRDSLFTPTPKESGCNDNCIFKDVEGHIHNKTDIGKATKLAQEMKEVDNDTESKFGSKEENECDTCED